MTARDLPQPQTVEDFYLAALLDVADSAMGVLGEIRDRLPARPVMAEPGQPVELREPDVPAVAVVPAVRPASRARRSPRK